MTREELIKKEAKKYSEEKWKHPSSNLSRAHCSLDYMAGINSQLAKDLQELAVIEGKIEVWKYIQDKYCLDKTDSLNCICEIQTLEQTRDKLINELKLK